LNTNPLEQKRPTMNANLNPITKIVAVVIVATCCIFSIASWQMARAQEPAGTDAPASSQQPGKTSNNAAQPGASQKVETTTASGLLSFVVLGVVIGAAGQSARVVVGIKAEMDKAGADGKKWDEWFDGKQLIVSLMLGGIAGLIYSISLMGAAVDKQFLIGGLAAGYAGADFIEGFMTRFLGNSSVPSPAPGSGPALQTPSQPQTRPPAPAPAPVSGMPVSASAPPAGRPSAPTISPSPPSGQVR
jgi:hypothetical protein